jgi:hypothetical protein
MKFRCSMKIKMLKMYDILVPPRLSCYPDTKSSFYKLFSGVVIMLGNVWGSEYIYIVFSLLWYVCRQHNGYFKINRSTCLHWFYLITATCVGPYFGLSTGSFIKYVSCYWINTNNYNHHNSVIIITIVKLFLNILPLQRKILLFVAYCRFCLSSGVSCYIFGTIRVWY